MAPLPLKISNKLSLATIWHLMLVNSLPPNLPQYLLPLGVAGAALPFLGFFDRFSSDPRHLDTLDKIEKAKKEGGLAQVPIDQRLAWVSGLQKGTTRSAAERAIRDVILSISGPQDMVRAVVTIELGKNYYDLGELLDGDIDDVALKQEILNHMRRQLPKTNFVWLGDTVEGDFQTALRLSQRYSGRVVSFIRLASSDNFAKLKKDIAAVERRTGVSSRLPLSNMTDLKKALEARNIYLFSNYSEVRQRFDLIKSNKFWLVVSDVDETALTRKSGREVLIPGHHDLIRTIVGSNPYFQNLCSDFLYVVTARPKLLEFDALNSLMNLGRRSNRYRCTAIRSAKLSSLTYYYDKDKWHAVLADEKLKYIASLLDLWSGG